MKRCTLILLAAMLFLASSCSAPATPASTDPDLLRSWLQELQLAGSRQKIVAEFRKCLLPLMDEPEARLRQQELTDDTLYDNRHEDSLMSYYYDVIEPLTAEQWQNREFSGAAAHGNAAVEYVLTLNITDPARATVESYAEAPEAVHTALLHFLQSADADLLRDTAAARAEMQELLDGLSRTWQPEGIEAAVEFVYRFEAPEEQSPGAGAAQGKEPEPAASAADYAALLTLMRPSWQEQKLAAFNEQLLDWANEHEQSHQRLDADLANDIRPTGLGGEEQDFLRHTVYLSGMEIGRHVQSLYTGSEELPPVVDVRLPEKRELGADRSVAWADLQLSFSYIVRNPEQITVAERDTAVQNVICAAQNLWAGLSLADIQDAGEAALYARFAELGPSCSTTDLTLVVEPDRFALDMAAENEHLPQQ